MSAAGKTTKQFSSGGMPHWLPRATLSAVTKVPAPTDAPVQRPTRPRCPDEASGMPCEVAGLPRRQRTAERGQTVQGCLPALARQCSTARRERAWWQRGGTCERHAALNHDIYRAPPPPFSLYNRSNRSVQQCNLVTPSTAPQRQHAAVSAKPAVVDARHHGVSLTPSAASVHRCTHTGARARVTVHRACRRCTWQHPQATPRR